MILGQSMSNDKGNVNFATIKPHPFAERNHPSAQIPQAKKQRSHFPISLSVITPDLERKEQQATS